MVNTTIHPTAHKRTDQLVVAFLTLVSAIACINLRGFPVFVDEAIDLWWVWRITRFGEWLRPLGDGKPLEAWPLIPFAWLGADPLLVARILHALAGIASVLLIYLLAKCIVDRKAACAAALLAAVSPLMVFYQRLTLADTYLCAAGMLTLYAALRFIQGPTLRAAILLSAGMLLAAFSKLPVGFLFAGALPLAVVWMPRAVRAGLFTRNALRNVVLAYLPIIMLLAGIAAVSAYQIAHGQAPGFGLRLVIEKTATPDRVALAMGNASRLVDEFLTPITWPVGVLALIGIAFAAARGTWRQRWLISMAALPIAAMTLAASLWGLRYMLFTIPMLAISAVSGWQLLLDRVPASVRTRRVAGAIVFGLCLALSGYLSALRIFAPVSAQWSQGEIGYLDSWASGYGFPELADHLQRNNTPPVIYTLEVGPALQLRAYLPREWTDRVQQLQIVDGQPLDYSQRYDYLLAHSPAWLVTTLPIEQNPQFNDSPLRARLRPIATFDKPMSGPPVNLYEVMPQ
jgi:4-amino-4-deoxy-L-arabinose transferase-like glycosyltransferase